MTRLLMRLIPALPGARPVRSRSLCASHGPEEGTGDLSRVQGQKPPGCPALLPPGRPSFSALGPDHVSAPPLSYLARAPFISCPPSFPTALLPSACSPLRCLPHPAARVTSLHRQTKPILHLDLARLHFVYKILDSNPLAKAFPW